MQKNWKQPTCQERFLQTFPLNATHMSRKILWNFISEHSPSVKKDFFNLFYSSPPMCQERFLQPVLLITAYVSRKISSTCSTHHHLCVKKDFSKQFFSMQHTWKNRFLQTLFLIQERPLQIPHVWKGLLKLFLDAIHLSREISLNSLS